jgi:hypothetical protein
MDSDYLGQPLTQGRTGRKVLFLDIDGVLNSHRTAIAFGSMFGVDKLDPIAVKLVRGIVDAADACVVLSSSWRLIHDFRELGKQLDLPIIDKTPSMLGPRGREIKAWLDGHPECTQYAIVDDDGDMLPEQMPYFVKTHMHDGFTWACAEKLSEILCVRIFDVNRGAPLAAEGRTLQWEEAPGTP